MSCYQFENTQFLTLLRETLTNILLTRTVIDYYTSRDPYDIISGHFSCALCIKHQITCVFIYIYDAFHGHQITRVSVHSCCLRTSIHLELPHYFHALFQHLKLLITFTCASKLCDLANDLQGQRSGWHPPL